MILAKRPDVERFLAQPGADIRVVLLYGKDRAVVRERADQVAVKATARPDDPFDVAILTETDMADDPTRLVDELAALSLMGGRRLVRLKLSGEKPAVDRAAADALKQHVEGLLNTEALFLIEAGALGKDSALRKAGEQAKTGAVVIPCYEDDTGDIARMVRETLSRDKVGLTSDALDLVVARLPRERGVVRQEIERLALFLGPGTGVTATPNDLAPFLGVEPEASLSDAAADAFGGRLAAAQAGLRRAFAEGENGPAAVRAIGFYLGRMRRVLTLHKSGAGLQEAAKAAGIFWKQEREFLRQARAWSLDHLGTLQPEVLTADRACKQTGSPDTLIAERLALTIAGRARRLGL
jgi:DNA polymerase-3 subunit delta